MALWPQRIIDGLIAAHDSGRLAHAYLFCGARGSGKMDVIEKLSARILASDLAAIAEHPDFHFVEPESKSRRILIEQIRRLERALRAKPLAGTCKVALVREADRLQPQAANAFLKTLEEPPAGSHVFLTSSSPSALLQTIVSRCVVVQFQSGNIPSTVGREELLTGLEKLITESSSPIHAGFTLARLFQDILGRERERIRNEAEESLKAEQKHYKQTTDSNWLEEREEQLKALSEASAIRTRNDLMQTISGWFADVLRVQYGSSAISERPAIRVQAASTNARLTLHRIHAIEETASLLDRGVQEALAIEAGFLKLFSISA